MNKKHAVPAKKCKDARKTGTSAMPAIRCRERLADKGRAVSLVHLYGILQGGMPYPHTHENGLKALNLFSDKAGLAYMGGFVMGMGAMLNGQPLEKLFNAKKVIPQLNLFFDHVEKGEESPRQVFEAARLRMPGLVWRLMARYAQKSMDRDLQKHGMDVKQQSPYL